MMKVLKYILLFVIAFQLSISACKEDFLELTNENQVSPEVFWQDEGHAKQAIIGAYSPMGNQFAWGRMRVLMTTYRGDAVNPGRLVPGLTQASNFSVDPAWGNLSSSWGEFWKVVFRANEILEQVPLIEDPLFTEESRNAILGEAYFLRALQYFYLLTQFRNIPLTTEAAEVLSEVRQPPAAPAAVWQQIISDLQEAQDLLPNAWDDANLGRATWGAATGLLGKTYLYRSGLENVNEYGLAAAEFKKIIDSRIYELTDDHADNFVSGSDREFGDNNKESLFEIQLDNTAVGWGADTPNDLRTAAWEPDLAPPGFTSQTGIFANQFVLDAFLAEPNNDGGVDPRAQATLLYNFPGAMVYETPFLEAFTDPGTIAIRKGLDFREGKRASDFGFGGFGSDINWKIMRYADILLMYAEAENEVNGGSAQALDALNQVRARSNMSERAASDQATLRQQIRDERLLELVFEGDRYMDLFRWGMIPEAITLDLRQNLGSVDYQPDREYLAIPQIEIDTNPFYEQNEGYR